MGDAGRVCPCEKKTNCFFPLHHRVIDKAPIPCPPLPSRTIAESPKWPKNRDTLAETTETPVVPHAITTIATTVTTATAATTETTPRFPKDQDTIPTTQIFLPAPRRRQIPMATAAHTVEPITTRRARRDKTPDTMTFEIAKNPAPMRLPTATARPKASSPFAQRSRAVFKTSQSTTTEATTSALMTAVIMVPRVGAAVVQGAVAAMPTEAAVGGAPLSLPSASC